MNKLVEEYETKIAQIPITLVTTIQYVGNPVRVTFGDELDKSNQRIVGKKDFFMHLSTTDFSTYASLSPYKLSENPSVGFYEFNSVNFEPVIPDLSNFPGVKYHSLANPTMDISDAQTMLLNVSEEMQDDYTQKMYAFMYELHDANAFGELKPLTVKRFLKYAICAEEYEIAAKIQSLKNE